MLRAISQNDFAIINRETGKALNKTLNGNYYDPNMK